jgi:hypothetical protein
VKKTSVKRRGTAMSHEQMTVIENDPINPIIAMGEDTMETPPKDPPQENEGVASGEVLSASWTSVQPSA